ncbi:hypothetical protein CR513_03027, partial [Mucuna pruriens]
MLAETESSRPSQLRPSLSQPAKAESPSPSKIEVVSARCVDNIITNLLGINPSMCMDTIRGGSPTSEAATKAVVPKKSRMTVVKNQNNELVPTRVQNSRRVCINYRKLNQVAFKDHFPLPFIDQVLEMLIAICRFILHWQINIRLPSLARLAPLPTLGCHSACATPLAPSRGV